MDHVVANVAGCGSSMKDYGHLLADDPEWAERAAAFSASVRDVHEVLADLLADGPRAPRHPVRARVAYHDACHLGHAQGVRTQPRAVLRSIPGLEVVDIPEAALCCGSAGIYNMVAPAPAAELGARKAANIRSVQPDMVVTANPGCLLQIGKHLNPPGLPTTARLRSTRRRRTPGPWTAPACRCCTRSSCSTPRSEGCRFPVPAPATARPPRRSAPAGRARFCRWPALPCAP